MLSGPEMIILNENCVYTCNLGESPFVITFEKKSSIVPKKIWLDDENVGNKSVYNFHLLNWAAKLETIYNKDIILKK